MKNISTSPPADLSEENFGERKKIKRCLMAAVQEIQVFAMTTQMEDVLLSQASTLGLVITHSGKERSGRGSMQRQRI